MSRLASQSAKVVLTGDGGDEVLSGYPPYVTEKIGEAYRKIPPFIRAGLYQLAAGVTSITRKDIRYRLNRLTRFLYLSGKSFEERFIAKLSPVSPLVIQRVIRSDVPQILIDEYLSNVFGKCNFKDPFYRLMYFHLKVSLPDDMLTKVDRMSMAYSLEARVPFLDHRIIELTYSVDKNVKLPKYELKHLLRQTFGSKLPPALLNIPKKSLRVPFREWFMHDQFEGRLLNLADSGYGIDPAAVKELVATSRSGQGDYGDFLWRLFVLKNWHDKNE
jgi:asparagine synthase (glutamine-hydrolysing)